MSLVYRPNHPMANDNGMVDFGIAGPKYTIPRTATNVISDVMEPTRHMCDGQYYDSKARFREVTKAHGCIEVGNETNTLLKPREYVYPDRAQRREDIKRAIYDLRNGIVRD